MQRVLRPSSVFKELRGIAGRQVPTATMQETNAVGEYLNPVLETRCLRDQRGFTKMVTCELGLDQRAGICQVEKRRAGISGLKGSQVQRHGGMTKNDTCEVHSMPETESGNGMGLAD